MGKEKPRDKKQKLLIKFLALPILLLMIPFLPIIMTLAISVGIYQLFRSIWLGLLVKRYWYPQGKILLFVYSNSPNWKEYIEENILPKLKDRAVVLNWSEKAKLNWKQKPIELKIFLNWASVTRFKNGKKFKFCGEEYNPIAIIFTKWWKPKVLKFWQPFKDYKHGIEKPLKEIEKQLFEALEPPFTNK